MKCVNVLKFIKKINKDNKLSDLICYCLLTVELRSERVVCPHHVLTIMSSRVKARIST